MPSDSFESSAELFYLCWNDHMKNILQVFMEQLTSEDMVDVTITCEGKFIKAHKMILSACSPYFHDIFTMHDVSHPLIIMNDVKFSDMKLLIEFMYCGETKVPSADFKNVLTLAQNLQIKGLSSVENIYEVEDMETPVEPLITISCDSFPDARKRKYEDGFSFSEDDVKKKKRQFQVQSVSEDQSMGVDDLTKNVKIEPPDADVPEVYCNASDTKSMSMNETTNQELQCKIENKERMPEGILLNYVDNFPLDSGSEISRKNSGNIFSGMKTCSIKEYPSNNFPNEVNKTEGDISNLIKSNNSTGRIRRPPNAFMIFATEWRSKLSKIYESESNSEISRRLGDMWQALKKKDKEVYFKAAKLADLKHKEKYPGYYYSPQEARLRKRSRQSGKKNSNSSSSPYCPIQFAKVYITDENNASIPVLIALNNPEVLEWVSNSIGKKQKKVEIRKNVGLEQAPPKCQDD